MYFLLLNVQWLCKSVSGVLCPHFTQLDYAVIDQDRIPEVGTPPKHEFSALTVDDFISRYPINQYLKVIL